MGIREAAGADEVREIDIGDGTGRMWEAWRHARRYTFIGPKPGRYLFESLDASSWGEAIAYARKRWKTMDPIRRDRWYGPNGRYTLER